MKTIKKQDINLNQFITRKNVQFLSEKDGEDLLRACKSEMAKRGESEDKKFFQFQYSPPSSSSHQSSPQAMCDEIPGCILALFDHVKRSFGISEDLVSGFKCKVYLPGSEGLIDPSTLVTHSRYICVLGVRNPNPKEEMRTEDKIAEAALLSVVDSFDENANEENGEKQRKNTSLSKNHNKPKEVFTFSIYGMSKPCLLEQGQIAGIDGMFSNVVAINFNNQRNFKMPPISNGYRETIVLKRPEKRLVIVLDIEQTAAGLLKSVEKMKSMMQKKKMLGF